jgi:hypothetical protein
MVVIDGLDIAVLRSTLAPAGIRRSQEHGRTIPLAGKSRV